MEILGIIIVIFFLIKYINLKVCYKNISVFYNKIDMLRLNLIDNDDLKSLKDNFLNLYIKCIRIKPKNNKINEFIHIYTNLDKNIEKWNKEFNDKKEQVKKYDFNIKKTQEFFKEIDEYKNEYFTTKNKNEILNKYKNIYDYFTLPFIKELNINIPINFIQLYYDLENKIIGWNFEFTKKELEKYKNFFDNIDNKSLDYQQRNAVVTDDTNNLILAGAGSGKTLTIAAKVKYLVECKNIKPEEILLISFTNKAANEMTERIKNNLNIPVESMTFHKLGMEILRKNNKYKVLDIIDSCVSDYFKEYIINDYTKIKEIMEFFFYYLNVPKDIEDFNTLGDYIDEQISGDLETLKSKYNKNLLDFCINDKKKDLQTVQGEKVRSIEEVMIANFLFMNGIKYEYEKEYPYKNTFEKGKSYHPDFYLTDYDIYLEHFGITKDNRLPWLSKPEEERYLKEMKWKREIHKRNKTKLIETYSYYNKEKRLLKELKSLLITNNVKLEPIDLKEVYNKVYANNEDYHFSEFEKLLITFIKLYKANGYSENDFYKLNNKSENTYETKRNEAFLKIVKPIYIYYEMKLKKQNGIDFNDMINLATKYINESKISFNYKYIIIDEFQDISIGRYKLIKAILNNSNAKLICVGDDWQSIYRFSGSDLSLFSNFEKYFGEVTTLRIEKTYRNSQELLDIAKKFIEKNPEQLKKVLISDKRIKNPIMVMSYVQDKKNALKNAISDIYIHYGENAQIMILGRTKFDINDYMDDEIKYYISNGKIFYTRYPKMNIQYITVHSSKGLEADNVIILNMQNNLMGFPNKIADDRVLEMVLQNKDEYEYAEERRLFYVAITRTRNKIYLIAPNKHYSIFLEELKDITNLKIYMDAEGKNNNINNPTCPRCQKGFLVVKEKDKKTFLGCSNYPYCNYTVNNMEILDNQIRCDRCGGYMVKREGKYGDFWGCCNYPYCKNTIKSNKDIKKYEMKR